MRLALVALVCIASVTWAEVDGGTVLDIDVGELVLSDGTQMGVVGGCYLDDPKCLTVARELVSLRAETQTLKETVAPPAPWVLVLIGAAFLAGGAAGAAGVALIRK